MIPVASPYPPGAVCVITGELTRYARFNQCLAILQAPTASTLAWNSGPLIAANMDQCFAQTLWQHDPVTKQVLRDDEGAPLTTESQWAWIMGDDHTFAPDVLLRLLQRQRDTGADVIIPGCLNRTPPCAFILVDELHNRHRDFDKVPHGFFRVEDYEVTGDAGMLISRRAIEATGPPWHDTLASGSKQSEDRAFTRKIRDCGFAIHMDTTVTLGHITPCVIEPVWDDEAGAWLVRFSVGADPLVQFRPVPVDEAVPA